MDAHRTTVAVQRYLDALAGAAGDAPAEPVVRALLARSVHRLQYLCGALLHRHYSRLAQGPANVQTDELLSGVVERLMKAMREVRPPTVRQFFALANRHIRWELNDLARRLDRRAEVLGVDDSYAAVDRAECEPEVAGKAERILLAIDGLPEEERETFNLVRLQGLTKAEAAGVQGVSEKTVKRRLSRALARLTDLIDDASADSPPSPEAAVAEPDERGGSALPAQASPSN